MRPMLAGGSLDPCIRIFRCQVRGKLKMGDGSIILADPGMFHAQCVEALGIVRMLFQSSAKFFQPVIQGGWVLKGISKPCGGSMGKLPG